MAGPIDDEPPGRDPFADMDPRQVAVLRAQAHVWRKLADGMRLPLATIGLLVVIGLAHLLAGLIGFSEGRITLAGIIVGDRPTSTLIFMGAMYGPKVGMGEVWRLVSCLFLHGDGTHILLNGIALHGLGGSVSRSTADAIPLVVPVAGVSGSTLSFLGGNVASVGASGSIRTDGRLHRLWASIQAGAATPHRGDLSKEATALGGAQPGHRTADSLHRQPRTLRRAHRGRYLRHGGVQPNHPCGVQPLGCARVTMGVVSAVLLLGTASACSRAWIERIR